MKFALVLKFDESNPDDWVCYQISNDLKEIEDLDCYSPERICLPKGEHEAELLEDIIMPSCRTGKESEFYIIEFQSPINLANKFQFV